MREKQVTPESTPKPPSGRAAVLDLIKREGPIATEDLAARLGVTAMAIRQHLAGLESEGLATHEARAGARGRPAKLWQATAAANTRFADSHSALAADLVVQMKKAFGEDGLDKILKLRTAEQAKTYGARVADKRSLKARLDALARIRSQEGYMADVKRDPETGDWLFVENHCPICAAARLCTGLCREELALFNRVLGSDVRVERVSHILAGANRCAYRVTARA
jgi:predicted ArsR family transcriptional regulator